MEASRFSQGGQDQPTRGELKIESWKIQRAKLRRLPAATPIKDGVADEVTRRFGSDGKIRLVTSAATACGPIRESSLMQLGFPLSRLSSDFVSMFHLRLKQ